MKKGFVAFSLLLMLVGCGTETNEVADNDIEKVEKQPEGAENTGEGAKSDDSTTDTGTKDDDKDKTPATPMLKDEYIKKLEEVKKGLAELEKVLENGTQVEMTEAQGEIFKRWDQALNEIYGVLKKQLPADEMNRLREEQRNWITYRDDTAKEEALPFEGGSMQSLQYISTQSRITEERCYELVESYMD